MGTLVKTKFVMVTNRGPNFSTDGKTHKAMGGTKGIYPQIMKAFCDSWLFIASEDYNTSEITSEYGDKLDALFIDPKTYHRYYYEYVSEKLYPKLLGYKSLAKNHSRQSFDEVMSKLVARLAEKHSEQDIIICDYHLYSLPELLPKELTKIFFWFIPILTIDQYDDTVIEILNGLNHATEIYFFDDVWAQNFINLFHHFLPTQKLEVQVKSLLMGPDDFYLQPTTSTRKDYAKLLLEAFGEVPTGNNIISVSRMDFVKRLPLLIEGFEKYLQASGDRDSKLLLFAPHHRQDSSVYAQENNTIVELTKRSPYRKQIFITHQQTDSAELRTIFKYADAFVCPSNHDAMPLTPLEYILANNGHGTVVLSDSLGSYRLLSTLASSFNADDVASLATALNAALHQPFAKRSANMKLMKQVLAQSTIQRAIIKLAKDWS